MTKFCMILQILHVEVETSTRKIWRSSANCGRVIAYFRFSKSRPSASLVIADHPRLVFDGPIILLKLHVDHVYIFARYRYFYIRPVCLEMAYSRPLESFEVILAQMTLDIVEIPWRWLRKVKDRVHGDSQSPWLVTGSDFCLSMC